MSSLLVWFAAFFIDLKLGDPDNWPHPVRWIGNAISKLEKSIRAKCQSERSMRWGGVFLAVVIVGGTWAISYAVIALAFYTETWLGYLVEIWMVYTVLATKCLKDAALRVYDALKSGSIEQSREKLSWIVGRDTTHLEAPQITRAVTETVAENTVDGVISPLFFLLLGGAPFAMAYKAINTLDSMVGYKNEKYRDIGMFSARMDDVANYIPARLSLLFFTFAAWWLKLDYRNAFKIGRRDCYRHKSPNSGWSEATVAGALGVRLGGPSIYFNTLVEKPWMGEATRDIEVEDIPRATQLMMVASCAALTVFALIKVVSLLMI